MRPAPPAGGLGGATPPAAPMGYFTPPVGARPAAILWFRVYAVVSALAVVGTLELWQFLAPSPGGNSVLAYLGVLALSGPFLIIYGLGACVPYKPWGWRYALILIGLGMLGCLAPFSVVLVIMWTRPEVKAAFGRA